MVYVPAGVLEAVLMVRLELPDPATEVWLNEALAPEGKPLAERPTVPENPPTALTDTE